MYPIFENISIRKHRTLGLEMCYKFFYDDKGFRLSTIDKIRETINSVINFQASRGELMKLLWAYLKKNNLQCDDNKQYFVPDKKMVSI